jgi:hypothetical protein
VDAWRGGVERAEAALWGAVDPVVRDAHADLCVAVAAAVPTLADHPAVRAPLLRALANGGGGGGTSTVLSHWHARLPGNPAAAAAAAAASGSNANRFAAGADDNAAAGNLGRRLCAAFGMLPTAPTQSAAAATAAGWLAATCHVVLAVPQSDDAYRMPLCEDDLMECEFYDAVVDTAWQGASLPMAPLFSTQGSQGSQGVGGSLGGNASLGTLDRPSLSSTQGGGGATPRRRAGAGGAAHRPGMVLATPAPPTAGATFSTQFDSATLTPGGGADHVGLGATQAELPPWLRRSAMGGSQGDTIFDGYGVGATLGSGGGTPSSNLPMRRLIPGGGGSTQGGADGGGGKSVSWASQGAGGAGRYGGMEGGDSAGYHVSAERRRQAERERAKQKRHAVTLVRSYRAGELPDVRGVTPAALLDPLAALALRDAATASSLLSALMHAALAADDSAAAAAAGKKRSAAAAAAETSGEAVGPLRGAVRDALTALLPVAAADQTLAAWVLDAAAADPAAPLAPVAVGYVRRTALEGGCLAGGIIALEAHALHLQGLEAEAALDSKALPTPAAKRPRTSGDGVRGAGPAARDGGDGGGGDGAMGPLWEALAGLHRAAGDDVASRMCLTVGGHPPRCKLRAPGFNTQT